MDPERFKQVSRCFMELCDLESAAQEARLDALSDPEIAKQVRKMLAADKRTTRALRTDGGQGAKELLASQLQAAIPERIGPYRVLSRVGAGGMGVVYEAEESHPRRRVALKIVHPWLASPDALELFRFEAQAMAGVVHPGIPQVFAAGEADGTVFLAMEFVAGAPLFEHVARHQLDLADRMRLVADIATVVHEAHRAGLIHRDLKPDNIRLSASGQPKVLDFGIAMPRVASRLSTHGVMGTPAYAPPEQLEGGLVDPTADLYALGTLAWELATGNLPYEVRGQTPEEGARVKRSPPPPLPDSVPADLAWVIRRALSPDSADRQESAAELADHLRRAVESRPLPGRGGLLYQARLAIRRRPRTAGAVAVVVLGMSAVTMGSVLWERSVEAARTESAWRRLDQLEQTLQPLVEREAWDEVDARLDAFVTLPEHQGTPALAEAWRSHAERLRAADRPGALQAAVLGWTQAADDESASRSGETLVRELIRGGRYHAAWLVARQLPGDPEALAVLTELTAIPRRDLDGPGVPGAVQVLGTGVRTPIEAVGGTVLDLDGDGRGEFLALTEAESLVAWRLGADGAVRVGALPHPEGVVMHGQQIAVDGDRLFCSGRDESDRTRLFTAPADLGGPWTPFADLDGGGPTDLTRIGRVAYVSTGWPDRGLYAVDLDSGAVHRPHPPTDATESDVTAVEARDLNGDGQPELLVAVGDWRAYDLRRLEGPEWTMTHRAVLGTVSGIALPRGPDTQRLVAVKVDRLLNPAVFGPEEPYGPPAGIYRFDTELGNEERIDLPVGLDRSRNSWAEPPEAADLDGDGWDEVLVGYRDFRHRGARDLVVVPAAASPTAQGHVLAGLALLGTGDLDGDGDHEVVVRDEQGVVWFLGTGSATLPTWSPSTTEPIEAETAPAGDASVARVWSRAQALVGLGLVQQAAGSLEVLGRVHDDPAVRAAAHRRAGALSEVAGDRARAVQDYRRALEDDPDDEETRTTAIRILEESLRIDEAQALGGAGWTGPQTALLLPGPLDGHLRIERPEALLPTESGWSVELFNDQGTLFTLPVEADGGRLGVTVELEPTVAEIGAGLAVEILDDAGEQVVYLEVSGEGGGGATDLVVRCLDTMVRQNGGWHWPAEVDGPLVVQSEWLATRRGCRRADDAFTLDIGERAPAGRYTVRVRAAGHPDYRPPMLFASALRIRLHGMRPAGEPARGAAHALAEGTVEGAASDAWTAARSGDREALIEAVRDLRDDPAALRRLIRQEPGSLAVVSDVLGDDFSELVAAALTEPFRQQPWRHDLQAIAARSELDTVGTDTPRSVDFALARAEVLRQGGRPHPARRLAEAVLATEHESGVEAHLILARLSASLDPDDARAHVEAYVAASDSPELARARTRRDPTLARLSP